MRLMYVTLRPAGQPYDPRMGAGGPGGVGPTIVAESRWQVSILFGFLTLAFTVTLVRGVTGAQTTSGRVAVVVLSVVLLAVFISAWIRTLRHPARLEITEDAIGYVRRNGQSATVSRPRHPGTAMWPPSMSGPPDMTRDGSAGFITTSPTKPPRSP